MYKGVQGWGNFILIMMLNHLESSSFLFLLFSFSISFYLSDHYYQHLVFEFRWNAYVRLLYMLLLSLNYRGYGQTKIKYRLCIRTFFIILPKEIFTVSNLKNSLCWLWTYDIMSYSQTKQNTLFHILQTNYIIVLSYLNSIHAHCIIGK